MLNNDVRQIIIVGIIALVPTQLVNADAIVRIRSDQPANAYLDGKLAGSAPLTVSKMRSGSHTVKIENAQTGELKIFNVYSPAGATAEKDIDVSWVGTTAPVAQVAAVQPTSEVVQTTYVGQQVPVVVAPQNVVYRPYYGPRYGGYGYYDRRAQEARDKVRSRNVLLGAALTNEVFNTGSSKGLVRGVTVGGALLNEVLRTGR